jgi:polyisoprenoid-binding protein YceI
MSIAPGRYTVGPEHAELLVRTGRAGAAAKAGHDLVIEVGSWSATLEIASDPADSRMELSADGGSMRVRDGTGGITALGDDDKKGIRETIDTEILKRTSIRFVSTSVSDGAGCLHIQGELELLGRRAPITFDLTEGEGETLTASAVVTQSKWGMKPYSTLFGTLKVADDVEVTFAGTLTS